MEKGTHGKEEKKFEELTYPAQAKSLNAQIQVLKRALNAHFRKGKDEDKDIDTSRNSYKKQLSKIIDFLNKK